MCDVSKYDVRRAPPSVRDVVLFLPIIFHSTHRLIHKIWKAHRDHDDPRRLGQRQDVEAWFIVGVGRFFLVTIYKK